MPSDEDFAKQDEAFVRVNLEQWRASGVPEREIAAMFAESPPGVRAAYRRLRNA